jgi:tetratricopeptide (TPR) repeat protein
MRHLSVRLFSTVAGLLFALNVSGQTTGAASRPQFDADNNNPLAKSWVSDGNLSPVPPRRLTIRLFKDGLQIASTMSSNDGSFHFDIAPNDARYELRIELNAETEFRAPVSFKSGFPSLVRIDAPQNLYRKSTERARVTESTVSVINLKAPRKAVQELDAARTAEDKGKFEDGLRHLEKALQIYDAYPAAYNQMGMIQRRLGHRAQAEEMFHKAIEIDPKWMEPYLNLAQLQMASNAFAEMFKTTGKAFEIDPNQPLMHFFQAVGFFNTSHLDAAEKEALLAEQHQAGASIPEIHMILGNIYEAHGKKADALARYRLYLKQAQESPSTAKVSAHVAALERELGQRAN